MSKRSKIAVALFLFATGCSQQAGNQPANETEMDGSTSIPAIKILSREEALQAATETRLESTPKPDAQGILDRAIAAAKAEDKALLVHFSADW